LATKKDRAIGDLKIPKNGFLSRSRKSGKGKPMDRIERKKEITKKRKSPLEERTRDGRPTGKYSRNKIECN